MSCYYRHQHYYHYHHHHHHQAYLLQDKLPATVVVLKHENLLHESCNTEVDISTGFFRSEHGASGGLGEALEADRWRPRTGTAGKCLRLDEEVLQCRKVNQYKVSVRS